MVAAIQRKGIGGAARPYTHCLTTEFNYMNIHSLQLAHSTSRGQDSYGWNIVTLRDENGKAYRTKGGGYDMQGTVFADWLEQTYQPALQVICDRAGASYSKADGYKTVDRAFSDHTLYGMSHNEDTGRVSLDGGCGISSMIRIAEAIGLTVKFTGNRKGNTTGYIVSGAA